MKRIILRQAYDELNDAVGYYEGEQIGLGLRMLNEINEYIHWIMKNPTVPRVHKGGYRRVNLKIFPYYIAYIVRGDKLWVLAIAHNHRKPEYWIVRKGEID